MKRALRIVGVLLLGLLIVAGAGLAYVKWALPNVGEAPQLTIQADSAQIAHGRYLANHVALCVDCHSTRDWTKVNGPMVAGTEGKGGEGFLRTMGFPGNFYARNITPAHLSDWTDGELYRAITTGVSRDGRALFPVMPYLNYARMDPRDIKAIIAYVRSLQPIKNTSIPAPEIDFPVNFILNTMPKPAEPGTRPDPSDKLAYGRYLTTFANCSDCHTPVDGQGQPLPGKFMAGGREFPMPGGTVRSANLTPDHTGLMHYTEDAFVAKFKSYADPATQSVAVGEDGYNSIMPWAMYAGMTESDLRAVYTYLKTLTPVPNTVTKFTPKANVLAAR